MPLFKIINHDSSTKILVWKISESLLQLNNEVKLNQKSQIRLDSMKSEMHKCGFLSVRKLLQKAGYSDSDLFYDVFGKPHLTDGNHISISHSYQFSTIIIGKQKVGIDIEKEREKIIIIADKFNNNSQINKDNKQDYIKKLTVIWGAKEAIFKIRNEKGISFKDNIIVNPFQIKEKTALAKLEINNTKQDFSIHFQDIEDYGLVWALEKN
jgi:4'-phosphopantetheinyl transferase